MTKANIPQYSATAASNTDVQDIDIAENCAPSGINNAIREIMADLKDQDTGAVAMTSPVLTTADINGGTADNVVIGGSVAVAGTFTTVTATTGVAFSDAGSSGTSNSNLLDDYEEGTWTPVYEGTSGAGSNTYDKQLGYYTKIGNLVTATLRIRTDALSGMTGNLRLAGLPFSVRNLAAGFDGAAGGIVVHQADTFGVNYPTSGYVVDNTSTVLLSYVSAINADPSSLTIADLGTGSNSNDIMATITYLTAT